jgi:DNA-binding transcriptional MocR family regulator
MLLRIRRESRTPVYKQICGQVAKLVEEGSLLPGSRLPATRVLASGLGINRSTVYRAYQELWALGYLESRPGSYSTVRGRLKPFGPSATPEGERPDWERLCPPASQAIFGEHQTLLRLIPRAPSQRVLSFAGLSADRDLAPAEDLRSCMRCVLQGSGKKLLDYGDPQGSGPLREVIARRMRTHGISVSADEVLVTSGSQQGLDLVTRLLAKAGSGIALESPTYSMAIPLFRFQGLRMAEVPMLPGGADLDALARAAGRRRLAFFYTIPNFQNPTGISTNQAHRERLLALCEERGLPLVEDGFEEEMKYFGKAVLPVKSMDTRGLVVYLGTFSKVVFPGLRVGWIAAERECIRRLLALSRFTQLSGNQVTQAAVARFCGEGLYEQHLRRVHRVYRSRMWTMLHALENHMPTRHVTWTRPSGGYTLWVQVDGEPAAEPDLLRCLDHHGVAVAPGSLFFPGRPRGLCFRLSVSNLKEPDIEQGCRHLGKGLSKFLGE